jgi:hypothetical protein
MSQKRVIVTIERPEEHEEQLQHSRDLKQAIDAGTTGISTVNLGTLTTTAQAKQDAAALRLPGGPNARNDAFDLMFIEQDNLRGQMQVKVDALVGSIEAKVAYTLANGFQVQDFGVINKQDFVVVDGPVTGSNKLVAKASEERSFHEWNDSVDNGTTWRYVVPTLRSTRVCDGYNAGQLVKYRHRIHTKNGPGDWHFDEIIVR